MKLVPLLIFTLFFIVGCASTPKLTTYNVYVDSVSKSNEKLPFVIVSGMKGIPTDDLRFQQYSEIVKKALKQKGYAPADSHKPHLVIKLSYSVSDPKVELSSATKPTFGYDSDTHKTSINGYKTEVVQDEYCIRKVSLKAYDRRNRQVWATDIESEGYSNDLRVVFPYFMSGAIKYLGENTPERVYTEVSEKDPIAADLRKPASN